MVLLRQAGSSLKTYYFNRCSRSPWQDGDPQNCCCDHWRSDLLQLEVTQIYCYVRQWSCFKFSIHSWLIPKIPYYCVPTRLCFQSVMPPPPYCCGHLQRDFTLALWLSYAHYVVRDYKMSSITDCGTDLTMVTDGDGCYFNENFKACLKKQYELVVIIVRRRRLGLASCQRHLVCHSCRMRCCRKTCY